LSQQEPDAQALLDTVPVTPGQGVWVRWHQVEDFYFSNPSSRHFTLDPISGQIRFGDGSRGKIPPVGRDNIRALIYRTHNGVSGNVAAGNVTALRNPRGDLANIKVVTNHEATGGGADQEPVEQVKLRGPQTLKHRQRAVAMEDYEWLAREAGGDLAQVWCLPTRNPLGLSKAGWVLWLLPQKAPPIKDLLLPRLCSAGWRRT
jgi:predicted phage baseplate assembly protein